MQIKSKIINANAGSGKTYSIIERVVEIINAGHSPSSILCITFTKVGVEEMNQRLASRCKNTELLKNGERPKIITFHALCQEIVCMFSYELNMPYEFEMMENIDYNFLESITKKVLELQQVKNLILSYEISYEDIAKICKSLIQESYNITQDSNLRNRNLKEIFSIENVNFEELKGEIYSSVLSNIPIASLQCLSGAFIVKNLPAIMEIYEKKECNVQIFWQYIELVMKLQNKEIKPYKQTLQSQLEQLKVLDDFEISLVLNGVFNEILHIIETQKKDSGKYTFEDIIQKARAILQDPHLRDFALFKFGSTYKHILVDEAQDTNQDQWEIIQYLLEEAVATNMQENSLFIVGDVKQTIYGFQGAEAGIMKDIHWKYKDFLHEEYLTVSRRTTKPVLDVINEAFQIDEKQKHVSVFAGENGGVKMAHSKSKPGKDHDETGELAYFIAQEVQNLLNSNLTHEKHGGRKIVPSDIAILMRSRNEGSISALKEAFFSNKIPIVFNEKTDYKTHSAVLDFIHMLKLCVIEGDAHSLYFAMKSPIFGIPESDFAHMFHKNTNIDDIFAKYPSVKKELDAMKKTLNLQGLTAFFYSLYAWHREKYTKQSAEILTIFIDQTQSYEQFHFIKYIQYFEKTDQIVASKPGPENAVLCTTAHSCKGLQYPIVFYFEIPRPQLGKIASKIFIFHGVIIWCNSSKLRSNIVQNIIDRKITQMQDEETRLQYVIISRTEERFYYVGNHYNTGRKEDGTPTNPISMYHKLELALKLGFETQNVNNLQISSYVR